MISPASLKNGTASSVQIDVFNDGRLQGLVTAGAALDAQRRHGRLMHATGVRADAGALHFGQQRDARHLLIAQVDAAHRQAPGARSRP
jgi:hypothetical protein